MIMNKLFITAVLALLLIRPAVSEEDKGKDTLTASEAMKKVEEQIFYPDEQKVLESADYTLIYSTPTLMTQFNMQLTLGDRKNAKATEKGFFGPGTVKKKSEPKRPAPKKDKKGEITDTARTWPDYEVTMGFWRLADPANLLMQLFIIPLHQTFPEDKWKRQLTKQDDGYQLVFIPKSPRPISGNDPAILIVNSVALTVDKTFVVNKVKLGFDQTFMKGVDLPGAGALKFAEDSDVEVIFARYKDRLLIKELRQVIQSGSPNPAPPLFAVNLTPVYSFEFKEISGFLLPTVKKMMLPGGQLSGTMGGMELYFLIEYLDYKVATNPDKNNVKKKK